MTTSRGRLSAQCSGCSGNFFWSAQPSTLFPLLCGDLFCRSCLVQKARAVLSARAAPLRCCKKVVPHDFVRDVLDHEEDVYYSFLLKLTSSENASTKSNGKVSAVPMERARAMQDAFTAANSLRVRVANAEAARARSYSERMNYGSPPAQPRYLTRSSKARLASHDSKQSEALSTASSEYPPALRVLKFCAVCGIRVYDPRFTAPCGDEFCLACIVAKVTGYLDAKANDSAVPASCCGKLLPLNLVRRVVTGPLLTTYEKRMSNYVSATASTPRLRGTKRKAVPETKPSASPRATRGSNGKAPVKRAKKIVDQAQESKQVCVACYTSCRSPEKLRIVPCGHGYCSPCLAKMARVSLTDRNLVPVSCCSKEFPMEYVEKALTRNQFMRYKRYLAERDPKSSTLKSDRDYTTLVHKNRGKQCPLCGIGVVKVAGCNAITCPLGHYFCWKCLKTSCICRQIYKYR